METLVTDRHQRFSNRFFLYGQGFLCLIVYTLLIAAIAFIRGQIMNPYIFPIAVIMTGITQFFAAKNLFPDHPLKNFFQSFLIVLGLAGASIGVAGRIYDSSVAGQWYHQETVRYVKTGWNPYLKYLSIPDVPVPPGTMQMNCSGPDETSDSGWVTVPDPKYMLINYQPKAAEIVEAAIYSVTGRLETGKAVNLLALLGAGCLCLAWLYRQPDLPVRKKWMLGLMAAGNPVTLAQLLTFDTDGTAAALNLALFVSTLLIVGSIGYNRIFLFGLLLIIGINIQASASVGTAIIACGFLLYLFLKRDRVNLKKIFYASLLAAATGFIFIGFHPYVTNFISGENVLRNSSQLSKVIPAAMSGRVWAGYAFPLWLLPLSALVFLVRKQTTPLRLLRLMLYSGMILIIAFATWILITNALISSRIDYQMQQMKTLNEPVLLEFCSSSSFQSNEWRLQENDISFNLGNITGGHIEIIVQSSTRAATEDPLPALPKSTFVIWGEKLSGRGPGFLHF